MQQNAKDAYKLDEKIQNTDCTGENAVTEANTTEVIEIDKLFDYINGKKEQNEDKEKQIAGLRAQLSELTEQENGKLAETMSANAAIP